MRGTSKASIYRYRKRLLQEMPCCCSPNFSMWDHLRGCPKRELPGEPCCSYVPAVVADTEVDIVQVSTTTATSLGVPSNGKRISSDSPQCSLIAGPSTVRLPVFHELPPLLIPKEAAVHSTFYASRSEILSPFSPRMATNTSSSESLCNSKASFDSLQGDTTAILNILRGIVSTLSTINSRLQALETQVSRCLPPITSSTPVVMPVMFRSPARTQDDLDAREAELANSEVYDVMKSLSRMGGMDVADTIRRMMSFLIHHDLAIYMNWSGVCNKPAACDLLSMELVQDAIMSQQKYADVSSEELLVHMRRWFRNARDRAGGRTKLIPKKTKSKDVDLDGD